MKLIFKKTAISVIYFFTLLISVLLFTNDALAAKGCCETICALGRVGWEYKAFMSEQTNCKATGLHCSADFKPNSVPDADGQKCVTGNTTKCIWKELTYTQAKTGCKVFDDYRLDARNDQCEEDSKPSKSDTNNVIKCCCYDPKKDVSRDYDKPEPGEYRGGSKVEDSFDYDTPTDPLAYANYNPAVVIGNVIRVILLIVGSIALIMFIYGGFTWMTSFGNESRVATAKKVLIWSTMGLFIIFLAYILVGFLLDTASVV